MNRYETLLFPDSNIFREKHYPLLLFFTPLHFLQLVEPEDGGNSGINHESDLFLQHGLCQAHIPAPLGKHRLQFLRLIDDIRNRKEYYVAKLRAMTIGSETELTSTKTADQKHGIVSSLLQEYGLAHQTDETNLELWQARLMFAIAEMLDSDEDALHEQLSEQLAFFNEEEIAVYRSLQVAKKGKEDDLFSELKNIKEKLEKPRLSDTRSLSDLKLNTLSQSPTGAARALS